MQSRRAETNNAIHRDGTSIKAITLDKDVDPYVTPGGPSSGLLYGISDEAFGQARDGDLQLQSNPFQLPTTNGPENRVPSMEPKGYNPTHMSFTGDTSLQAVSSTCPGNACGWEDRLRGAFYGSTVVE